jgi:hypothetical protein
MQPNRDPNEVANWTLYQARMMSCDKKRLGGRQSLPLDQALKLQARKKEFEENKQRGIEARRNQASEDAALQ